MKSELWLFIWTRAIGVLVAVLVFFLVGVNGVLALLVAVATWAHVQDRWDAYGWPGKDKRP